MKFKLLNYMVLKKFGNNYDYRNCLNNKAYSVLDLEAACLFANLIFKNEIDKIYFLRQYIGHDKEELKRGLFKMM